MIENDETLVPADLQQRAADRGAQPALVERFGIRGLYGYRSISLSSKYAATILIAKNGTGKTTLMGALDAFLRLQLNRLRGIDFDEIFCRLKGLSNDLIITRDDVVTFLQPPNKGEFARLSSRTGIDVQKLFQFFMGDFETLLTNSYNDHDVNSLANVIVRTFSYDQQAALSSCNEVFDTFFDHNANLRLLRSTIRSTLAEYEVVYLPTYRRIELALTDEKPSARRQGRSRGKMNVSSSGLHTGDIQFGLGDISERLSELNAQIISRSNRGYREISENIINEMIHGYEVSDLPIIPEMDDLKLFFSRLESRSVAMGPYYRISAPDYERIYSGEGVPTESRRFLSYFLGKLNGIINITQEIEKPVEAFIANCNKYLCLSDPSTTAPFEANHKGLAFIDAKALVVDRTDLSVHVESVPARKPIGLDALSSGEKQMVSLFAKMYLYPKKKLVLIDEPELSLSIDWQRGILVDVLLSPLCEQVIAITHSPFVFDNTLEPFARGLELEALDADELKQISLNLNN